MFHKLFSRRKGIGIATIALGLSAASLAFAGTAGAATFLNPPAIVTGSGSNTAYDLMTQLGTLFNQSPGCDLTAASANALTLQCESGTYVPGGDGENGDNAALENPYNDLSAEYPAVGSGNGVKQLYTAGSTSINFARSSANPANSHGLTSQNYIEYAIDGVSWIHFTEVNGKATNSASVTNISEADLTSIYEGTQGCKIKGKTYTMNWICEGGKAAPIDCYVAQTGSGTEKTWAADIVGGNDAAPCLNDEHVGTAASHAGLLPRGVRGTTATRVTPSTTSPPASSRWRARAAVCPAPRRRPSSGSGRSTGSLPTSPRSRARPVTASPGTFRSSATCPTCTTTRRRARTASPPSRPSTWSASTGSCASLAPSPTSTP
jgi:ABC-type phosphate transport system substrate-binding protein